jgi:hypothetical protein
MTASTELSEAFNPATEEGSPELTLLPKGAYLGEIENAIIKPYKSGKGQAVNLTWSIMDEKYGGRKVWQRCTLSHESEQAMKIGRQQFKDIVDACGLVEAFTDLTLLYNKPCLVHVGIEEDEAGKYPPKNKVVRVKPISAKGGNGAEKPFSDSIPF